MKKTLIYAVVLCLLCGGIGCKEKEPVRGNCASFQIVDLIPQIIGGVVHIQATGWQGSGFVVSDHLIVTARHVVEGCSDFTITYNDGSKTHTTRAISSKRYDIGFIYVEEGIWTAPLKLGGVKDCVLGQPVIVIGSSYGSINFNCVSTGIISGLDRNWDEIDPYTGESYGWEWGFTTDTSAAPGNSGCPLFTVDGVVRGILVGGYDSTHIFLMPSDLFMADLASIQVMFEADRDYEFEGYYDAAQ